MKDFPAMSVEELEREARKRIARYERPPGRARRAFRAYIRFMDPIWVWMCRLIYGLRYSIPISDRTRYDNAVMTLRVSPLIGGVVAIWVLAFAGVIK